MLHADIAPTQRNQAAAHRLGRIGISTRLYPLQRMYCGQTYRPYYTRYAPTSLALHTCQLYHTLRCGRSWLYGATPDQLPRYWLAVSLKAGLPLPHYTS